jgi:hypothetical protein
MPDENPIPGRNFGVMELLVVYLLTDPERKPTVWSVPDIGRELDYCEPEAVVYRLRRAGLIHQISDDFVVATPAAFHLVSLVGHVI